MTRFTTGVVLLGWAGCVAYPLVLLQTATLADFTFLRTAFVAIDWYPQLVTMQQVQRLSLLLGLSLLTLVGLGLALLWVDWQQCYQLPREWAVVRRRIRQALGHLSAGQRWGLAVEMLALLVLRLLLSRWLAPDDDRYSYRLFVRQPLLLISTCYPIPTNHVLTNSISRLCYLLHPGCWWSMRLPVVLLGTLGMLGWYVLLLVRTNFRVASLAVGAFSCLQISLFNAAEGRGYWLILALSALGFDSVLTLSSATARRGQQLPWLALALLGPLGLYAVPTFAYFLFSAYSWLVGYWLVWANWRPVIQLGLLFGGMVLVAVSLYAPLFLISGFEAVAHNPYVRPAADVAAYWRSLPAELWVMEGRLTFEKHVGGILVLAVGLAGSYLAWRQWQAAKRRTTLLLPLLALWFITSPYLLMVAQRVRAPERTLLYKSQFFFLLGALVVEFCRCNQLYHVGAADKVGRYC